VGDAGGDRAQRWARPFVTSFLAAFLACGLAGIEAWPLTGFRLFSTLRTRYVVSWEARAVLAGGEERPIPFGRLPPSHRAFGLLAGSLAELPRESRDAACAVWAADLRALGWRLEAIRVYRVERDLLPRAEGRAASRPVATLRFSCAGGPADG
jgi:hypothetical protein